MVTLEVSEIYQLLIPEIFFSGKILFPGTGILVLVWQTFAFNHSIHFENLPVIFEDVRFMRATNLKKNQDVVLSISIDRGEWFDNTFYNQFLTNFH